MPLNRIHKLLSRAFLLLGLVALLPPAPGAGAGIVFWTTEVETKRLEIQEELAYDFTTQTGIQVEVVPVSENRIAMPGGAEGTIEPAPDVVYHPAYLTADWAAQGLLDIHAAHETIQRLGPDTFSAGAQKLLRHKEGYGAVPMDGWRQLLFYRKDLFEQKGLPAPDSWQKILRAAQTLHNPPRIWGFIAATEPDKIYTQQVFEHFAMSGGVKLLNSAGNIKLNTPEMVATLKFYDALAHKTPRGEIGFIDSRHEYVAGRAAMIVWSPFILDEISGLRRDLPVVPDIRQGMLGYLARNTGLLPTITGPGGPAQYYSINGLGIVRNGNTTAAQQWIEFLLSDGYLRWLNMAPWSKLPMRKGTASDKSRYLQGWMNLDHGPHEMARFLTFIDPQDALTLVEHAFDDFDRWRSFENYDALISKIYETRVIPQTLRRMLDGDISAEEAAGIMNAQVKALNQAGP